MDKTYLAGFFDGEGCVGLYANKKGGNVYVLRTQLVQNSGKVADTLFGKLQAEYGGYIGRKTTSSGKLKLNWVLSNKDAARLLTDLLPFLEFKKEQASVALEWHERRPLVQRNKCGQIMSLPATWVRYTKQVSAKLRKLKQ